MSIIHTNSSWHRSARNLYVCVIDFAHLLPNAEH